MKTAEALYKQFGKKFVPLKDVATEFYGVTNERVILRMAERREFPGLRPFKASNSKKAP